MQQLDWNFLLRRFRHYYFRRLFTKRLAQSYLPGKRRLRNNYQRTQPLTMLVENLPFRISVNPYVGVQPHHFAPPQFFPSFIIKYTSIHTAGGDKFFERSFIPQPLCKLRIIDRTGRLRGRLLHASAFQTSSSTVASRGRRHRVCRAC